MTENPDAAENGSGSDGIDTASALAESPPTASAPKSSILKPSVSFASDSHEVADIGGVSGSLSRSLPPREGSFLDRRSNWPRSLSERKRMDHMDLLIRHRRLSMRQIFPSITSDAESTPKNSEYDEELAESLRNEMKKNLEMLSEFVKKLQAFLDEGGVQKLMPQMEIRLTNVSYRVPAFDGSTGSKVQTVYNASPLYKAQKLFRRLVNGPKETTASSKQYAVTSVLSNVNLVLRPKNMYLILGPPLSGKTSLLKAIAGMLPQGEFPAETWLDFSSLQEDNNVEENKFFTGKVEYNNLSCSGEGVDESLRTLFKNLVAFVRQNDAHAPRLTVGETFAFSSACKHGSITKGSMTGDGRVNLTLEGLGLSHVKDTFVGNEQIRGVSGGQRRRVTLGEMLVFDTPLLCGDEISTGLDTASTVDILRILSYAGRVMNRISVVSLLQPSPEAVSLFDEIILLGAQGHVIYAGPTGNARRYFQQLGYEQPDGMDDADYLLAVASSDRRHLYRPDFRTSVTENLEESSNEPHNPQLLSAIFQQSKDGAKITERQKKKWAKDWNLDASNTVSSADGVPSSSVDVFRIKYQNSFWTSVWLNFKRSFILWTRDRIFIRANAIKNIAMGLSVGFVFFQTNLNSSYFGVLFQGNLFIMLGAMTSAPEKLNDRVVFYKHNDSNFYPSLSYIIGQALSLVPQMIMDVLLFGTLIYWLVGFTETARGFFMYLALFFSFNFTMAQCFGVLAAVAPSKTVVQAGGAVILLLNTLFCGYIVSPNVIPDYYIWIYWMMPLAWVYRALLLNEYTSDKYEGDTGDVILESFGITLNGKPFSREWIGYCFAFLIPFLVVCMLVSAACLHYLRMEPKQRGQPDLQESTKDDDSKQDEIESEVGASFIPVTLSFSDLCYEVKSSVGPDKLRLLNNVSGIFSGGRMCALMGESGAGKTTLMDVIALRKQSGEISGEILLNGFPQESVTFRRCSGYVEQFDVQSPELTVRETIRFSALLRLDKSNPIHDRPNGVEEHVDYIIQALELTKEADTLVGNEEEGGLTFEQKKRLSIAVELAASPSIVFLDEPTSGLDARAALLVMNGLKKMCSTGRTIVATIHQPSSAVFDMFDDLLLLKKGGEVVFFGDLGSCSANLISYFEDLGASPISKGENPSTWMLNVLGEKLMTEGDNGTVEPINFAETWKKSKNYEILQQRLKTIPESRDGALKIEYDTEYAATKMERDNLMANRLVTIYWRSPAYNLSRMALSLVIAFLLSSVFIVIRSHDVFSETELTSMLATIFISFIIIGVLSITSVLPVMLSIRDMFYRHKAAGMLNYGSVARALATAEKRFILFSSLLFCIVFIPLSGIVNSPTKPLRTRVGEGVAFWGFFTFNMAIYSYIGQLFMCLVRGPGTAQILASVFIGINNFFSGLIVRPQQMTGLWAFTYWINPGHFVYEGLCMSVFHDDDRHVIIGAGSDYWDDLNCEDISVGGICQVEVSEYVHVFFGGLYKRVNLMRNTLILGGILFFVRASTYLALKKLTYSGK